MPEPSPKRPDQAVPLVIYKGGERLVIGSAYLKGDGSIEGQIAKDVKKELKDILFSGQVGDISINPTHLSTHIDRSTNKAVEIAVVPPLKVQEP